MLSRVPVYRLTLLIALITIVTSATGLADQTAAYQTTQLREAFAPNDAVLLIVGLPVLAGSVFLAHRRRPAGPLLWQGMLLFLLYNYIAYLYALPFGWRSLAYLVLALLCLGVVPALAIRTDVDLTRQMFAGQALAPDPSAAVVVAVLALPALVPFAMYLRRSKPVAAPGH